MRFPLYLVLLLPSLVAAIPAIVTTVGRANKDDNNPELLNVLHPKRHPDDDPTDLGNLKAAGSATFYNEGHLAHSLVHIPVLHFPVVMLERSNFITSVTCNAAGNTMVVTFKDHKSWQTASNDWVHHRAFFIVSHVAGCGLGATGERSFHLVSSVQLFPSAKQIACTTEHVDLEQAAHPDHLIHFQVNKYGAQPPEQSQPDRSVALRPKAALERRRRFRGRHGLKGGGAIEGLYQVGKKVVEKTVDLVVGVYKLIQLIADPSATANGNFSFDTLNTLEWSNTPLGKGYVLVDPVTGPTNGLGKKLADGKTEETKDSNGKKLSGGSSYGSIDIKGRLGVYCIRCRINAKMDYGLRGTMTSNKDVRSSTVTGSGSIEATLGVGVQVEATITGKIQYPFEVPIPTPITIYLPGFLNFGPFFTIAPGISLAGTLKLDVLAGITCTWTKTIYEVNLFSPAAGSADEASWKPECKAEPFSINGTASVTISHYIQFALDFQLKILNKDSLTFKGGITAQASLDLILSLSTAAQPDCSLAAGELKFSLVPIFALSITAKFSDIYNPKFDLFKYTFPEIAGNCKKPKANTARTLGTRDSAADDSAPEGPDSDGIIPAPGRIVSADNQLALVPGDDGKLGLAPSSDYPWAIYNGVIPYTNEEEARGIFADDDLADGMGTAHVAPLTDQDTPDPTALAFVMGGAALVVVRSDGTSYLTVDCLVGDIHQLWLASNGSDSDLAAVKEKAGADNCTVVLLSMQVASDEDFDPFEYAFSPFSDPDSVGEADEGKGAEEGSGGGGESGAGGGDAAGEGGESGGGEDGGSGDASGGDGESGAGGEESGAGDASNGGDSGSSDASGGEEGGAGGSGETGSGDASGGGEDSGGGDRSGGDESGSNDASGGEESGSNDASGGEESGSGDALGEDEGSGSGDASGGEQSGSGDSSA